MDIQSQIQQNEIADEVEAKVAVMRPILASVLHSLRGEVVTPFGLDPKDLSRGQIPLHMLGVLRSAGDGDVGIAFEYAIHDAIRSGNPDVLSRVTDALRKVRITTGEPSSIFFAIEKNGSQQIIDTDMGLITPNSRALSGKQGQPIKLQNYLTTLAAAFRRPGTRANLPQSIRGLWKADLFLGSSTPDHWVGTTIKSNPAQLEGATGLRIGIVPVQAGKSDAVRLDDHRGLVICPIKHDFGFMQLFYETWRIAQALMSNHFETPTSALLPTPADREVARIFVERRLASIADVIEATKAFSQPHLLISNEVKVGQEPVPGESSDSSTTTLVAPKPNGLHLPSA